MSKLFFLIYLITCTLSATLFPSGSPTMEPIVRTTGINDGFKGDIPGTGPSINDNIILEIILSSFSGVIMLTVLYCFARDLNESGVCKKGFRHEGYASDNTNNSEVPIKKNDEDKLKDL